MSLYEQHAIYSSFQLLNQRVNIHEICYDRYTNGVIEG